MTKRTISTILILYSEGFTVETIADMVCLDPHDVRKVLNLYADQLDDVV